MSVNRQWWQSFSCISMMNQLMSLSAFSAKICSPFVCIVEDYCLVINSCKHLRFNEINIHQCLWTQILMALSIRYWYYCVHPLISVFISRSCTRFASFSLVLPFPFFHTDIHQYRKHHIANVCLVYTFYNLKGLICVFMSFSFKSDIFFLSYTCKIFNIFQC